MEKEQNAVLSLLVLGAVIAVGKMLVSDDPIKLRLVLGRALLGSATAMVAGVALMQFPEMSLTALLGIGSALGIVGSQYLELFFRRWMGRQGGGRDQSR
ncbi:phage holin family protein [Cupriavidus respiraculi]|uniref:Holin n=1 Tax=Cupriavidus respiraculi TaxID=195930 RepID=A0ABN7ZFZ8_9BURK|nr:phage holin family protein [Cupriavidus respiraculi]CAG9184338.1 hypothetical protein LMG21510_05072 [Cupriavidus respiraculi]